MSEASEKYRAPALDKGLDILELLASHADGVSQSEIAKALNRSSSEIYRMLSTLVRRDYVTRSVQGDRYSLSLKMFAISHRHPPLGRLIEEAVPRMRVLASKAWQSCHISRESNGDIVVVATADSPGSWGVALKPGTVIGLWNTGSGRVLAAYRSPQEIDDLIKRHRRAMGEPNLDRPAFDARLEFIRTNGYECLLSDAAVGITNINFPIFGPLGRVDAVLGCPFLERADGLIAPSQDEVIEMYGALANELTTLNGGAKSLVTAP